MNDGGINNGGSDGTNVPADSNVSADDVAQMMVSTELSDRDPVLNKFLRDGAIQDAESQKIEAGDTEADRATERYRQSTHRAVAKALLPLVLIASAGVAAITHEAWNLSEKARSSANAANTAQLEVSSNEMPKYTSESVPLYTQIKLTSIQEALEKGYLVLNSKGKKVPAKGLDWKDDSTLDPSNPATWVLVKVYGSAPTFENQAFTPDVYASDAPYDMSNVKPYTTIGIKDVEKAKANGYIVNGKPAKGLDWMYNNPSKANLDSLTLFRVL